MHLSVFFVGGKAETRAAIVDHFQAREIMIHAAEAPGDLTWTFVVWGSSLVSQEALNGVGQTIRNAGRPGKTLWLRCDPDLGQDVPIWLRGVASYRWPPTEDQDRALTLLLQGRNAYELPKVAGAMPDFIRARRK